MFKINESVKCISTDKDIQKYGHAKGNLDCLEIGNIYNVESVDIHSWHTIITLKGIDGTFNSCLFENIHP
jgi:hypothetical protein